MKKPVFDPWEIKGDINYNKLVKEFGLSIIDDKLSKRIEVFLTSDSFFVRPGESVTISGTVKRLNGAFVNGEVEINLPLLKALEIVEEVVEEIINESIEELDVQQDNETIEEVVEEIVEEVVEEFEEIVEEEVVEAVEGSITAGAYYGKVEGGEFSVTFGLNENTPAGDYRVDVLAYEDVLGERASEGTALANLEVFQILSGIDIALSNQNIDPGSNLDFKTSLLDQTGINIAEEVSVIIRNENLNRIYEKIIKSQETVSYNLQSNLTSGYYEIEAKSGEFSVLQNFFVNEKAIVSFIIENETLIVTNIGNIPYDKDIEIELNGKPFVKSVKLKLGESKKLKLTGSNEVYEIGVSDGDTLISQSGVMLTGNSVNVNAIYEGGALGLVTSPIAWIFLIVIIGIGVLFLFRSVFKKKSYAHFTDKFKKKKHDDDDGEGVKGVDGKDDGKVGEKVQEKAGNEEVKTSQAPVSSSSSQAEQVLVLKGHKSNASAIVIKIKNKISETSKKSLEEAIGHVYSKKGAVYEQGDFIFIIFSPLMTKTTKNEVEAAKMAGKISTVLKEHNKKFSEKIDFGIGINSGEIINKVEDKKLKFTALGNFIGVAKRLAESSDKNILVTKESYQKGISELKVEKKKIGDGDVYQLRSVVDTEKNKKFIQGFLNRMKKDK